MLLEYGEFFIHSGCVKGIIMDVRIPPHNLDAEKAVLGALLTNGSNMGAVVDTVTSILKSEDFTAMHIVLFTMPF